MMTFLLFAGMRESAGVPFIALSDLPDGATLADAWAAVCSRHPVLATWTGNVAFARNGEYATADCPVADGDELAAIPPVSGG